MKIKKSNAGSSNRNEHKDKYYIQNIIHSTLTEQKEIKENDIKKLITFESILNLLHQYNEIKFPSFILSTDNYNWDERENRHISKWLHTASDKEKALADLMEKYEMEYFEDLTLEEYIKKPILQKISKLDYDSGNKNNIYGVRFEFDEGNPFVTYDYITKIVKANKKDNVLADCDPSNKTITFYKGRYEKTIKEVLLHEMIHIFETKMVKYPNIWDFILLELQFKISKRISAKDLRYIIFVESHNDYRIGSTHSLLFILKSLDLDMRLNLKLGTILNYGRDAIFGNIKYKKRK